MGDGFDPTCLRPLSETQGYLPSLDRQMLALEIAASVMRDLDRKHHVILGAKAGQLAIDLRHALDRELISALSAPSPPGADG